MRWLLPLLSAFFAAICAPAAAQHYVVVEEVVIVEEWVEVSASRATPFHADIATPDALARFGPFRVMDAGRAVMVGSTDSASPAQFEAMRAAYPGIAVIEMLEVPGTRDDIANLELGRMIRASGMETLVPANGSVRSGGVELFLAGAKRHAEPGAEFAVHSWEDELGQQAGDYAADAPIHAEYVAYYTEMGMSADKARAFYDMTNSVPHESARWLTAQDMRGWLDQKAGVTKEYALPSIDATVTTSSAPKLAYLDFAASAF